MQVLLKVIIVLATTVVCAVGQTINLTPDENYTVPYNSNENITYHCEVGNGQQVVWIIVTPPQRPDIQLETEENEYGLIIDTTLNESRLTVTQMVRNQFLELLESPRLEIGCFPFRRINMFPTRTITTFGPLEPPSSIGFLPLSASDSDNQLTSEVQLSWTAREVPNSEIDIQYYARVTNLSSGIVEEFSTREESIVFNETGICSEFNLTVFASNDQVGNSSVVSILENIPISPNISIISASIETVVDLTGDVSIAIKFRHASVCSDNFPIDYYAIMLENGMEILPPRIGNCTDFNEVCATINKTDIPGLSADQVVKYNVSACSNVTCRSTETLTAYTTGIQQPIVYFVRQSTYVLVTCNFANGSRAIGCLFNFTYATTSGDSASEMYNFTRDSKENSKLCNGGSQACMCIKVGTERFESYSTIEAFTLEEDGVTRSRISVPVIRRNVSDTPEMIAVCNPPDSESIAGEVIGGVLAPVLAIIIITVGIVIIVFFVRKGHKKQPGVVTTSIKSPVTDGPEADNTCTNENDEEFEITVRARVHHLTKNRTVILKLSLDDEETIKLIQDKAKGL